ncbi:TPA: amidophosphoribosyltransferase [Candidatus Latescibacteria bacterium]|nr:amidophosphoribosyltransferase [Candidatus Latescibacterota bacterium]
MDQGVKHYCGIFGVYGHADAARLTGLGLNALQHRGEESCGIAVGDGSTIRLHKGMGQVSEVFDRPEIFDRLEGHLAIGHNRYSTTGSDTATNAQPYVAECRGHIAVAHNGNLVNTAELRSEMQEDGAIFQTSSDSEVILHLIAKSRQTSIGDRVRDAVSRLKGAYSLVMSTEKHLIAARDPYGFRPLCLGQLGDAWIVASESCALDIISARYIRDIEPGELVIIDQNGLRTYFQDEEASRRAHCIFEFIYFSRPDSMIFGDNVDKTRRKFGKQLAIEQPADADIVISVPDSSNTAALGYADQSGLRFELGLIRNHYVGRTFITPGQDSRAARVRVKFNPVRGVLKGRRVVIVEDSIVRGTTLRHLARMIREAGARQIHVRVSCPPIVSPCFYGIDFQTEKELIANEKTIEEIREHLGVDSLGYLSLGGMIKCAPNEDNHYCTACFDRQYPIPVEAAMGKLMLENGHHAAV